MVNKFLILCLEMKGQIFGKEKVIPLSKMQESFPKKLQELRSSWILLKIRCSVFPLKKGWLLSISENLILFKFNWELSAVEDVAWIGCAQYILGLETSPLEISTGCMGDLKGKEPIYYSVPQFPHLQNGDYHSSGYKPKIIAIEQLRWVTAADQE